MQLCIPPAVTATGGSPASSGVLGHYQHLQGIMDNGHLTAQVQGNALYDLMEKQETAASVLTSELKMTSSQHECQLKSLADKVDNHTKQISTILSNTKQQD